MNYKLQEIEEMLKGQISTRQRWLLQDILDYAGKVIILEAQNETLSSLLFYAEQHIPKGDQK